MKKTLLLSVICMLSIMIGACNNDDEDSNPVDPNPPTNRVPSFTAIISGDIVDTISFTVPSGIFTDQSIIGSYVGVIDLLTVNVMELPTGFQFLLVGNRGSFGEGDFVATGEGGGFGAYNDAELGRSFLGTASTVTFTELELLQNVVQATYNASGTFEMTLEDQSTPVRNIEINGTFENVAISVNE